MKQPAMQRRMMKQPAMQRRMAMIMRNHSNRSVFKYHCTFFFWIVVLVLLLLVQHDERGQEVKDDLEYYYVTPLSIGVSDCYDEMVVQIPKNTTIPTKKFETISTTALDNQGDMVIPFYQGERKRASDNKLIGTLGFKGIPPAPRGVPKIAVCVDIDAKGNLNVSAEDKSTGRKETMSIPGVGVEGKLLSTVEVEEMARQGEKHKSDDEEFLKKVKVVKAMKEYTIVVRENAAAGAYSGKAHDAFMDAVGKMLDEFKEKAKDFGLEGDKKMCKT